jgi:membrane-bound lytic murein transglycosylase F
LLAAYWLLLSPINGLNQWEKIQARGYLTWITRPSPLTYYNSLDGIIGLEYDMLREFSEQYKLKLNVIVAPSNNALFNQFDKKNIDIAGANLTLTDERKTKYLPSLAYDGTSIRLISSYNKPKIKSLKWLKNLTGMVINNSSYVAIAKDLIKKYQAHITPKSDINLYELLQMITEYKIDYTLADSNIIAVYASYIPKLRLGKELTDKLQLVFYFSDKSDVSLKSKLDAFIIQYQYKGKIEDYKKLLMNTLPNSKPADTVNFLKNYKRRWPKVKEDIYTVAEKYGISPILLGAISYQESHWNPTAVSPTLVKGLMMLTKGVAKEQGVTDRFNPLQSLEGGAKHYLKMRQRIPERITEPDRTFFALASYNLGYGNVEQARVLAQKAGKNPDLWGDVRNFLPQLNEITGNKVDGETAVRYVDNIYVYQNLLQWKEQQ